MTANATHARDDNDRLRNGELSHDPMKDAKPIGDASTAIERAWRALDPSLLLAAPPARRWLLRHPTRDGHPCAPSSGDGLLPLGKVGVLASEGGVGKTNVAIALAVAIATGRKWLGHFEVDHAARRGRVLLALGEEDDEEIHRRLYNVARAFDLDAHERRRVAEQVIALALAGQPVAFMAANERRALTETAELAAVVDKLKANAGDAGWSLAVFDPLSRFAGPDVEADNAAATRFVQALESLTTAPGGPTVLVAHHSSKLARRTGSVDSRGVTAITDGVRWSGTLRADGADVFFVQEKSNYSRPMLEELRLVRGAEGLLRAPTEDEQREHVARAEERASERDSAKTARKEARIGGLEGAIVAALRVAPAPVTSREDLAALVHGTQAEKEAAVSRLLTSGRVRRDAPLERGAKPRYLPSEERLS